MTRASSRLTGLFIAVAVLAAIVSSSSVAAGTARWQPRQAESALMLYRLLEHGPPLAT